MIAFGDDREKKDAAQLAETNTLRYQNHTLVDA